MSSDTGSAGRQLEGGAMRLAEVVFFVVAAAAPLTVVVASTPLAIGLGNGQGTPGAYVVAAIVLGLFAVGYAAMSRHVTNAGAFYAYIARGLGPAAGACAAGVALLAYNALQIGLFGVFGFFAHEVFLAELGIDLPWEVWAFAGMAAVAVLGFFRVTLSARVLGLLLLAEVVILLMLDLAILSDGGADGIPASVFAPANVFAGAVGIAFMWAFASFIGFEATAIYGEETRDPRRTVARATYVAVALIAVFYAFTTWMLVAAFGANQAQSVAAQDPSAFVFAAGAQYLGEWSTDAMSILVVTSIFAAMLAFHNAASRYMYALGREGLLPKPLGVTHARWRSPYVAGVVQCALAFVVVGIFAIAREDPLLHLFSWMAGIGTSGVLALQAATSLAVFGFFRRNPGLGASPAEAVAAPLAGAAGLVVALVLVIDNFDVLTGSQSGVVTKLWLAVPLAALLGLVMRALATDMIDEALVAREPGAAASPTGVSPGGAS